MKLPRRAHVRTGLLVLPVKRREKVREARRAMSCEARRAMSPQFFFPLDHARFSFLAVRFFLFFFACLWCLRVVALPRSLSRRCVSLTFSFGLVSLRRMQSSAAVSSFSLAAWFPFPFFTAPPHVPYPFPTSASTVGGLRCPWRVAYSSPPLLPQSCYDRLTASPPSPPSYPHLLPLPFFVAASPTPPSFFHEFRRPPPSSPCH